MGLDIYLDIEKKREFLTKEQASKLDTFDRHLTTACRRNSKLADKLRRIYKEEMDYNRFYETRTHKYMQKLYDMRSSVYSETKDMLHIWLNTDYDLYDLFNSLGNKYKDDEFEVSITQLQQVYLDYERIYKDTINNGLDEKIKDQRVVCIGAMKQNLEWIKSVLDKATGRHVITFSRWY